MTDTATIHPTWARRITRQREKLGLTQQQLADRAGSTRETVIRWEKGKNQPPQPRRGHLANALEISKDELNGWFT
jgi:transcriptional regulator with XRE-family HTH domain